MYYENVFAAQTNPTAISPFKILFLKKYLYVYIRPLHATGAGIRCSRSCMIMYMYIILLYIVSIS